MQLVLKHSHYSKQFNPNINFIHNVLTFMVVGGPFLKSTLEKKKETIISDPIYKENTFKLCTKFLRINSRLGFQKFLTLSFHRN